MSITDELRGYARGYETMVNHRLLAIADRIDAEHKRCIDALWEDAKSHLSDESLTEQGWVRLPKDADGEVWHVGDLAVGEVNPNNPREVERMLWYGPDSGWQLETDDIIFPCPERVRHRHAPTVEDVLREMVAAYMDTPLDDSNDGEFFAEYAAKLRLAGEGA